LATTKGGPLKGRRTQPGERKGTVIIRVRKINEEDQKRGRLPSSSEGRGTPAFGLMEKECREGEKAGRVTSNENGNVK